MVDIDGNEASWKSSLTGSNRPQFTRPLALFPERENSEMLKEFVPLVENEVAMIKEEGLEVKIESDNTMRVRCEGAKLSMADGKMVVTLLNLGGAYWTMCTRDQSECQKESVIETGFLINRSVESITDLALSLTDPDSGDIIKEKGDYGSRMGVCGKPLTKSDLTKNIPVCHSKIRVFEFVIELLKRYLSHKKWWTLVNKVKYTTEEKEQYKLVRAKLKEDLYKNLAINIGDPGDMVTGAAFQIFSSDSSRKFLCGLIEKKQTRIL